MITTTTQHQQSTIHTLRSKARIRALINDCGMYPDVLAGCIKRLQEVAQEEAQKHEAQQVKRMKIQKWKQHLLDTFPNLTGQEIGLMLKNI